MLAPSTLEIIPELRNSTGMNNSEIVTAGVLLLQKNPRFVVEMPEQPYGSGKKPKVFNLPEDTVSSINALADEFNTPRTHVVDVALRNLADSTPNQKNPDRGTSKHLLELVTDKDLIAEVKRRNLKI